MLVKPLTVNKKSLKNLQKVLNTAKYGLSINRKSNKLKCQRIQFTFSVTIFAVKAK